MDNTALKEEVKPNKKSFFAQIPSIVLCDNRLSSTAKLVYGEIFALADENGECYPSNKYLGEMLGVTSRHISRCIKQLKDHELINYDVEEDNFRTLVINFVGIDKKIMGDRQKCRGGRTKMSTKKNSKKNIENKEIYKEKSLENSQSYLLDVPLTDIEEFIDKLGVSKSIVCSTAEDLYYYCQSKGKKYANYKALLRNSLKRETKGKEAARVFADIPEY